MPRRITKRKAKPDYNSPCTWARWMMRHSFVVWDTETTGLEDDSAIVSIGIVSHTGEVLLDTLINPLVPIPSEATKIHGVTDEMVKNAPTFIEVYPQIYKALTGQRWVIYNDYFDTSRLDYECWRSACLFPSPAVNYANGVYVTNFSVHDPMEWYAQHYGDWSDYHESYKWQSLSNAAKQQKLSIRPAHHALADALTTLELVKKLAFSEDRKSKEP